MQWNDRIGRRLRLRDLHILLAVVQRRSMVKAATDLAMSQPAVSKAVADLEHVLGVRLLDRTPQGIEPTAYGQALVKHGLTVFDQLKQAVQELDFLAGASGGELRVGTSESMAAGFMPALLDRFSLQYPQIAISVVQALFATAHYQELRERAVDLVVGRIPSPFAEHDLDARVIFDDPVFVVTGAQSRWARRRHVQLSELIEEPWILPPRDSLAGDLAAHIFREQGLHYPRAAVTTLSIHVSVRLVETGRFVATLPSSLLKFSGKDLAFKILPLNTSARAQSVGIITLKNRTLSPAAQAFLDCAGDLLQ